MKAGRTEVYALSIHLMLDEADNPNGFRSIRHSSGRTFSAYAGDVIDVGLSKQELMSVLRKQLELMEQASM